MLTHGLSALGIGLCLIANGLEAVDAVLERWVVQIGYARLDSVVEALEARFRFRHASVQLGGMLALALGALLSPVKDRGEDDLQPSAKRIRARSKRDGSFQHACRLRLEGE